MTKDLALTLKAICDEAVQDPQLVRLLTNEATAGPTLLAYVPDLPQKLASTAYTKIQFVRVQPSGYCIVPSVATTLVVVLVPSPTAVMQEMVGGWPTGSSPEIRPAPPGCAGGN